MDELLWWWNGMLCPERDVRLSPRDRGLRYGDGVYETVRVHCGWPFRLAAHLERMRRGLELVGIPVDPVDAFPESAITQLIAADADEGEGRLRLMVTRGEDHGNHVPPAAPAPTVLAIAEPLPPATPPSVPAPARLAAMSSLERRPAAWSSLKSLSHLSYVLAAREARRLGADDALLTDGGLVLETTAANLFMVIAAEIRTPAPAAGILAGVTRDTVIELARAAGRRVVEGDVHLDELAQSEEIFITGSVTGIRAVAAVDSRKPARPAPGPVTRELQATYADLLARECRPERPGQDRDGA